MKRKIKIRGRCNGTWRKGDHLTYANGESIKMWSGSFSPEYDVEPYTVGQFTGAYDCDGREIYEGDILQHKDVPAGYLEVFYHDEYCAFAVRKPIHALCKKTARQYRVVGNIYDDGELLN